MSEQDYRARNRSSDGYWKDRIKKAEAERDEALVRVDEFMARAHAAEHNFGVENDRAEEALAQVAMLSSTLGTIRVGCGVDEALSKIAGEALSNLPAAAKEMVEKARKWDALSPLDPPFDQDSNQPLSREDALRLCKMKGQHIDELEDENARLREALERVQKMIEGYAMPTNSDWATLAECEWKVSKITQAALSPEKP